MTPDEILTAAIAKLETQRDAVPAHIFTDFVHLMADVPVPHDLLVLTLHSTVDPILAILQNDVRMFKACTTNEQYLELQSAAERAGDLALAHAILGDTQ